MLSTGKMPEGPGRTGIPLESDAGRPKIWLAAHGPRMRRLAGQYADGWLPLGMEPKAYGEALSNIRNIAKEAGRKPPVASQVFITMLGESRDTLVKQVEQQPLAKMVMLFASSRLWDSYGIEHPGGKDCSGAADVIPTRLTRTGWSGRWKQSPWKCLRNM